jgi:hypothetical protein
MGDNSFRPDDNSYRPKDNTMHLIDYLNIIRWINVGMKTGLFVCISVLSFFCDFSPWTRAPFEVFLVLISDIYFSARYSVEHSEEDPWRKIHENKAKARIKNTSLSNTKVVNHEMPDASLDLANLSSYNKPSGVQPEVQIRLEFPISNKNTIIQNEIPFNDGLNFNNGLDSRLNWEGIINSLIDNGDSLTYDDSNSFDTESVIEEEQKRFTDFMNKANEESNRRSSGSLTRSNSDDPSRRGSAFNKTLPIKYVLEGLTKHHKAELRQDFDDSGEDCAEKDVPNDAQYDFLEEEMNIMKEVPEARANIPSSKDVKTNFMFKDPEED